MIFYVLLFCCTLFLFFKFFQTGTNPKLPPQAPWALPLFGHLLALGSFPPKVLLEWKKLYGPVYLVKFGSFRTVVFNDAKLAKEAFKLAALSDRPPLKLFKDATLGKGFGFVDFNVASEQRQFMLKNLKAFSANGSAVEERSTEELSALLDEFSLAGGKPIPIVGAFTHAVLNSVWGIIMGYTFTKDHPQLKELVGLIHRITAIPGLIESLGMFNPWFSNLLPDLTGVTSFVHAYKRLCSFVEDKATERKKSWIKDQPRDITDAYIDRMEETTDGASTFFPPRNFLPMSMAEMLVAAGDTTSTALEWIILYLAKHQEVQKRLQLEISEVVTTTRLPLLSDRPNMPYTEAVILEVLRITGFVPMALPHYTHVDTNVSGYLIPKDTLVFLNIYGIQHDPDHWDEPEEFRPDRFLDGNGRLKKSENLVAFGVGKRMCVGESVAKDLLFISVTRIFQRFCVKFAGKSPSTHGKYGITVHPEPFHAVFTEKDYKGKVPWDLM